MWDTLGLWFGPTLAVIFAAIGAKWLGTPWLWLSLVLVAICTIGTNLLRLRRKQQIAIQRIAERLAYDSSAGYDHTRERWLEHYLGGRRWDEQWDLANTITGNGTTATVHDAREPAPTWRKRLARKLVS